MIDLISNATVFLIVGALIAGLAKPAMADLWLLLKKDWRLTISGLCLVAAVALPRYAQHVLGKATTITSDHLQLVLSASVAVSALTTAAVVCILFAIIRALDVLAIHAIASQRATNTSTSTTDTDRAPSPK